MRGGPVRGSASQLLSSIKAVGAAVSLCGLAVWSFTILKVFVKATNKLQADLYPTIYYTIPLIYNIYNQLDKLKENFIIIIIINSYTYQLYTMRIYTLYG